MKELNSYQKKLLEDVYYGQKNYVGRDKLYSLIKKYEGHPGQLQVAAWLADQEVNQVHMKPKKSSAIGPILPKKPNVWYQADLIDMGENAAFNKRYIFTLIDSFTKQAFARALKTKKEATILKAFDSLMEQLKKEGKRIRVLQTDNGSEFIDNEFQRYLEENGIRHVTGIAGRPQGQGIIERFNGVLKNYIMKDITATGKNNWPKNLQQYLDNYNNTYHSIIKTTPNQAEEKFKEVKNNIEKYAVRHKLVTTKNLKVGDRVRVKIFKGKLDKYSTPNFSKTIFKIYKVIRSSKPFVQTKYKLINQDGQVTKNFYMANDLLKIVQVQEPPAILEARRLAEEKAKEPKEKSKKQPLPPSTIRTRSKD